VGETKLRRRRGTVKRRRTKCDGNDGRESECLVVLWTPENGPRPDPDEERRDRIMEPLEGKAAERLGSSTVLTKRNCNG